MINDSIQGYFLRSGKVGLYEAFVDRGVGTNLNANEVVHTHWRTLAAHRETKRAQQRIGFGGGHAIYLLTLQTL